MINRSAKCLWANEAPVGVGKRPNAGSNQTCPEGEVKMILQNTRPDHLVPNLEGFKLRFTASFHSCLGFTTDFQLSYEEGKTVQKLDLSRPTTFRRKSRLAKSKVVQVEGVIYCG